MATQEPEIGRNDSTGRFEVTGAPETGFLAFRRSDDRITLEHTEVADALEGQGVGSALVRTALVHAESEGLAVAAECSFVSAWLERHPQRAAELDIVSP